MIGSILRYYSGTPGDPGQDDSGFIHSGNKGRKLFMNGKRATAWFLGLFLTMTVCSLVHAGEENPGGKIKAFGKRTTGYSFTQNEDVLFPMNEGEWDIPEDERSFEDADPEEQAVSFELDPDVMDFETVQAGYLRNEVKYRKAVIVNTGETPVTILDPVSENGWFEIQAPTSYYLEPGDTATFRVKPVSGLDPGVYDDEITVISTDPASDPQVIYVNFTVEETEAVLTEIELPEIADAPNGVEKSAEGLGLPGYVTILTTAGRMQAAAEWEVADCSYIQDDLSAQDFTVEGRAELPEGVEDPDGISGSFRVPVSVLARETYTADPSRNRISGVDPDEEYTTETKISFSAWGDGMDNELPADGDTRFLPAGWKVLEGRTFEEGSNAASFRIAKAGGFTLSVTFNEQRYEGADWVSTGNSDVQEMDFHVIQDPASKPAEGMDGTDPRNASRYADSRMQQHAGAVFTGDETAVIPLLSLLALAAATAVTILFILGTDSGEP